jgi:CarD family transcriptional regulator
MQTRFAKATSWSTTAHGVGKVDRVGSEKIAGHWLDLIHISFAENRMTLRIPVAQARAAGLRKLANSEALAEVFVILRGRPRVRRLMWARRAQEYLAKINSGDLGALAEVVRDLQTGGDGSGSSASQRNLFELAMDRLAAEFAAISGTEKAEAVNQLTHALYLYQAEQLAATETTNADTVDDNIG